MHSFPHILLLPYVYRLAHMYTISRHLCAYSQTIHIYTHTHTRTQTNKHPHPHPHPHTHDAHTHTHINLPSPQQRAGNLRPQSAPWLIYSRCRAGSVHVVRFALSSASSGAPCRSSCVTRRGAGARCSTAWARTKSRAAQPKDKGKTMV